jgi:hypothetical protein
MSSVFFSFALIFAVFHFAIGNYAPPAEIVPTGEAIFTTHLGSRPMDTCPIACRCSLTTIDCSASDLTNAQLASMKMPLSLMSLNLYGNPRLTEVSKLTPHSLYIFFCHNINTLDCCVLANCCCCCCCCFFCFVSSSTTLTSLSFLPFSLSLSSPLAPNTLHL